MVPAQFLAEDGDGEGGKHDEGNDFLDDLELRGRKGGVADAVGGHLEAVFEERDAPTDQDDRQHGPLGTPQELQVAVPGERHEEV